MIIVAIIALSAVVLTALYAALVGLPAFPTSVVVYFNFVVDYIAQGASFFYSFTVRPVVVALLNITLAAEGILLGYKFVMWVAKKIPMFGVSD